MREKETTVLRHSPFFAFLVFLFLFFILFGFWMMILEQAALTHDIERIFRSKKTFQNDEGAKQHMAPSTSQAAWTFVRVD